MPEEWSATLLKIFRHPSGPLANNDVEDENGNVDEAVSPTAISTLLHGPIKLIGQSGQVRSTSIPIEKRPPSPTASSSLASSAPSFSPSCRNITHRFRSFTGNYKPSPLLRRFVNSRFGQGLGISHLIPIRRICCAHMACCYVDHRPNEPSFVQE